MQGSKERSEPPDLVHDTEAQERHATRCLSAAGGQTIAATASAVAGLRGARPKDVRTLRKGPGRSS